MARKEQLDSFYQYATEQLAIGGAEKSLDELYEEWRVENLTPEELLENVAAVKSAIEDMHNGDTGRDADEVERELRKELKLPTPQ